MPVIMCSTLHVGELQWVKLSPLCICSIQQKHRGESKKEKLAPHRNTAHPLTTRVNSTLLARELRSTICAWCMIISILFKVRTRIALFDCRACNWLCCPGIIHPHVGYYILHELHQIAHCTWRWWHCLCLQAFSLSLCGNHKKASRMFM